MAAGWYARRPAPLLTAALGGAIAGWWARSRVARRNAGAPTVAQPTAPESTAPAGGRSAPAGPTRDPSPLPEPVPFPEGVTVDAPYTVEEPYTGRPRYAPAARPWRTDVPDDLPP